MYGPIFQSLFSGSMVGSGALNFALMGYIIAHTNILDESVELNPKLLASILGESEEDVKRAIEYLCAPDTNSRTPKYKGSRLIREGQFLYHVVNAKHYRGISNEQSRRNADRKSGRSHHAGRGGAQKGAEGRGGAQKGVQGEGEGEGEGKEEVKTTTHPLPPAGVVEEIYKAYPRHLGLKKSIKAINHALTKIDAPTLLIRTKQFAASEAGQRGKFTPMPWTWFSDERYNDDPAEWSKGAPTPAGVCPFPEGSHEYMVWSIENNM